MAVFDLTDPRDPELVGAIRLPNGGWLSRLRAPGQSDVSVDVVDNIMFASGDGQLHVTDVRRLDKPRVIGTLPGHPDALWVNYDEPHLTVCGGSVQLLDVSRPRRPESRIEFPTPGQARSAAVRRDRIYVADGDAWLTIVAL